MYNVAPDGPPPFQPGDRVVVPVMTARRGTIQTCTWKQDRQGLASHHWYVSVLFDGDPNLNTFMAGWCRDEAQWDLVEATRGLRA